MRFRPINCQHIVALGSQDLSYPEEAGKVAPVPGRGVEHVRSQDTVDDANHVAIKGLAT